MWRSLFLSVLFVSLFSCHKDPPLWETANLNNNQVFAFGHGGMGIFSLHPMDSFESLQECLDQGADGTEMDLQLSRDNQLYLYHASYLEESTHCSGTIAGTSSSDLSCDYKGLLSQNAKLQDFATLFQKLKYSDRHIFTFECKLESRTDTASRRAFAEQLVTVISKAKILDRVFVETTNPAFVGDLQRASGKLKIFLYVQDFEVGLAEAKRLGIYGLTMDMNRIDKEEVKRAHAAGLRVTLFNQQTEEDNLKTLELSPDFIQTDRLKHLLRVLDKK
jgi:glycerophosphoryl diester phosphodiesterase